MAQEKEFQVMARYNSALVCPLVDIILNPAAIHKVFQKVFEHCCMHMQCKCFCFWLYYLQKRVFFAHSAFDTLAKVLNPSEMGVGRSVADKSRCVSGTTIHLIGRDQETPIIEVEGPLLTDSHVGFKVGGVDTIKHLSFETY